MKEDFSLKTDRAGNTQLTFSSYGIMLNPNWPIKIVGDQLIIQYPKVDGIFSKTGKYLNPEECTILRRNGNTILDFPSYRYELIGDCDVKLIDDLIVANEDPDCILVLTKCGEKIYEGTAKQIDYYDGRFLVHLPNSFWVFERMDDDELISGTWERAYTRIGKAVKIVSPSFSDECLYLFKDNEGISLESLDKVIVPKGKFRTIEQVNARHSDFKDYFMVRSPNSKSYGLYKLKVIRKGKTYRWQEIIDCSFEKICAVDSPVSLIDNNGIKRGPHFEAYLPDGTIEYFDMDGEEFYR